MAQITPRQEKAIAALLTTADQTAAAQTCGVGRRTLSRWLATPEFRDAYRRVSAERLWDTVGVLRAAAGDAVQTLRGALQSTNEHVRVRAAVALLEIAVKADTDELAARVEALEANARAIQDATQTSHQRA